MQEQYKYTTLTQLELEKNIKTSVGLGLGSKEVKKRLQIYGKNISESTKKFALLKRIVAQFKSPIIYILVFGGLITFILQEYTDSIIIAITLVINLLIGIVQEGKASKAFEELQKSDVKYSIVKRDGKLLKVNISDLVPGDIVILEAGEFVPADIRIVEQKSLQVSESQLTGEWDSVSKIDEPLLKKEPFNKQKNMVWKGTLVVSGTMTGIVISTGKNTRIGLLASLLDTEIKGGEYSPLQKKVKDLANFITIIICLIIVVIFLIGLYKNIALSELIFITVAVAVAAMPEGLPAAITVVLSLGMKKMLNHGGLVKRLSAAETLGSTTWIITDKTGTLTEGKTSLFSVITAKGVEINAVQEYKNSSVEEILLSGFYTSNVKELEDSNKLEGDSMEQAIVSKLKEIGCATDYKNRLDYIPFDSNNRFAAAIKKNTNGGNTLCITGAPELLFEAAKKNSTALDWNKLKTMFEQRLKEGKRIIAIADAPYKTNQFSSAIEKQPVALLENIKLLGFISFEDPIRIDVRSAVEFIKDANIRVSMATGDNPRTALYIAKKAGIVNTINAEFILGSEFDEYSDKELYKKIQTVDIFARMLPEHKLRLAKLISKKGQYVAMTGDGVNDAPTLKAASIGIALGSGTNVAKEASDLVLINDKFSTIVESIKEGRRIIDNLRRIVGYLLSTSFSEVILIIGALMIGAALPITPAQILWTNIVEETFIVFALAFEKLNINSLKNNPNTAESKLIVTKNLKSLIMHIAIKTGIAIFVLFLILTSFTTLTIEEIRTVIFIAISIDSIFFAASFKDFSKPIWKINLLSNTKLIIAMLTSLGLIFIAFYIEPIKNVLELQDIGLVFIPWLILYGMLNLFITEKVKFNLLKKQGTLGLN